MKLENPSLFLFLFQNKLSTYFLNPDHQMKDLQTPKITRLPQNQMSRKHGCKTFISNETFFLFERCGKRLHDYLVPVNGKPAMLVRNIVERFRVVLALSTSL